MFNLGFSRTVVSLGFGAFLIGSLLGLGLLIAHLNSGSVMQQCPFGDTAICTMNPIEHISEWQDIYTNLLVSDILFALALLLLALVLVPAVMRHIWGITSIIMLPYKGAPFGSRRDYIPNNLLEAFSNGILHPKIF